MRELELIAGLEQVLAPGGPRIVRWLGDDAAVVRSRGYAVTSVDTMTDGVHFRRGQLTPAEIGARACAAALSDLAAMAAQPGEAYLSLGLPPGTEPAEAPPRRPAYSAWPNASASWWPAATSPRRAR